MKMFAVLVASLALLSGPAVAAGSKTGFSTTTTSTQGSSGKPANTQNSTKSQGDTTTTTSGPSGALKNGQFTPNQTSTTTGPGKSMP